MLRYARPHNGRSERRFINRFLIARGFQEDTFGNLWAFRGERPVTLWSAHSDTVHQNDGKQRVRERHGIVALTKGSPSNCLGADNSAGVWTILQMFDARVDGAYVIHRGEEVGGLGSDYIAANFQNELKDIRHAIAFDRRGYDSVITHQGCERTASDAFGLSLASQLPFNYKLDTGGSFTDTANYSKLIPECTNVSIGFNNEHTSNETVDLDHVAAVAQSMIDIDQSELVCERDPSVSEYLSFYRSLGGGGWSTLDEDIAYDEAHYQETLQSDEIRDALDYGENSYEARQMAAELVYHNPDATIDLFEEMGVAPGQVARALQNMGGTKKW